MTESPVLSRLTCLEQSLCVTWCLECGGYGGHCDGCPEYVPVPKAAEPEPVEWVAIDGGVVIEPVVC